MAEPKDSLYLREELNKILKNWFSKFHCDPHFCDVMVTDIVELLGKWLKDSKEATDE